MDYKGIDFLEAGGWQNNDISHLVGAGKSGYRLVFKSLRLVPQKELILTWPNLRIKIAIGEIKRGGIKVENAFPSRKPDKLILADSVEVKKIDKATMIEAKPNMKWEFHAWEETLPKSGYLEILLYTEAKKPHEILEEGRHRTAGIKTILELAVGQRLLGLPIAEEAGEIFPDWHWNRNVGSISVGSESQLNLQSIENEIVYPLIIIALTKSQTLSEEDKARLRLASQWYWKADGETDLVSSFIDLWIAVEALEMPNTTNISPVKKRLSELTHTPIDIWQQPVGRLFGIRGDLVHGNILEVSKEYHNLLQLILQVLLEGRLFDKKESSLRDDLITTIKLIKS